MVVGCPLMYLSYHKLSEVSSSNLTFWNILRFRQVKITRKGDISTMYQDSLKVKYGAYKRFWKVKGRPYPIFRDVPILFSGTPFRDAPYFDQGRPLKRIIQNFQDLIYQACIHSGATLTAGDNP